MNFLERSLTANVVIKTTTDDFTTLTGQWRGITKENIVNLILSDKYAVEYIPSDDNTSTDTFIITEEKS